MTEIHVIPEELTSTWRVSEVDAASPLALHTSATDAELAARAWAQERGAERVVVHDRYHRVHDAAPSLAALRTRARRTRARRAERVVVHDRYHRVHDAAPSLAALRTGARRTRARQLAVVREHAHRLAHDQPAH